jgi:aspartyl-tRNA(Asn)/glutamyl-tRNA(Gln) amidotransferase subunit C
MTLSADDVRRIAVLARIEVSDEEVEPVLEQLNDIFGLIEQMQAIETDATAPMAHPQEVTLRLREDRVTERDDHAKFQANAPQVEAGLYLVPKVIE